MPKTGDYKIHNELVYEIATRIISEFKDLPAQLVCVESLLTGLLAHRTKNLTDAQMDRLVDVTADILKPGIKIRLRELRQKGLAR